MIKELTRRIPGHLLVCSLIRSLHLARFAQLASLGLGRSSTLSRSLAYSPTRSLGPGLMGRRNASILYRFNPSCFSPFSLPPAGELVHLTGKIISTDGNRITIQPKHDELKVGKGSLALRHYGPKQSRILTAVLGHSLDRLFVRSHRSLVRLLRTARFARALRCAHSLTRSLAHFAHSLARGKVNFWMSQNDLVLSHSAVISKGGARVETGGAWPFYGQMG